MPLLRGEKANCGRDGAGGASYFYNAHLRHAALTPPTDIEPTALVVLLRNCCKQSFPLVSQQLQTGGDGCVSRPIQLHVFKRLNARENSG
ncbi:MAG: hypothetical protein RR365_14540 [Bacteroides sp.]